MADLNSTPNAERVHIGFFGMRNAGKSSLVNAISGQGMSVVSDVPGTTTDAVRKSMEILPLGPVVIIDTPGYDDEGNLGKLRVKAAKRVLATVDIAVLVSSAETGLSDIDKQLIYIFEKEKIPYMTVFNKCDISKNTEQCGEGSLFVSAKGGLGIEELKIALGKLAPKEEERCIVKDIVSEGDTVILVGPIDKAAPKGRLILPQQQTIRDILDAGGTSLVVRDTEYKDVIAKIGVKPSLVITDSQVFGKIAQLTSPEISLTSFSVLMARYKGFLEMAVRGAEKISELKDGDTVLIAEGCTHHRQCGDIGTVKLPGFLKKFTGKNINIKTSSGKEFPEDLSDFSLVIHCGGCMLTSREVCARMKIAEAEGVPVTNFGTAIAYMNGILTRSIAMLPEFF